MSDFTGSLTVGEAWMTVFTISTSINRMWRLRRPINVARMSTSLSPSSQRAALDRRSGDD
jgi:hypothetical protein